MIKFDWKLNGRTVPADRIGEEFAKAAHAEIDARVTDAIAQVKCPVHGTSPRNIKAGRAAGGSRATFEYEMCCERLRQAVEESFQ